MGMDGAMDGRDGGDCRGVASENGWVGLQAAGAELGFVISWRKKVREHGLDRTGLVLQKHLPWFLHVIDARFFLIPAYSSESNIFNVFLFFIYLRVHREVESILIIDFNFNNLNKIRFLSD